MATFERRTDKDGNTISIRVKIRRRGFPAVSKTFDVRGPRQADINAATREAEIWTRQVESEMDRGSFVSRSESEQTTLKECLERYLKEITPTKKGAEQETSRIGVMLRHPLCNRYMATIRGTDLAGYRDDRLKAVANATVTRELAIFSHAFNMARKEWGMENLQNPIEVVRKPKLPEGRDRRLHPGELDAILAASESDELQAIIMLNLETAMRRGAYAKLLWQNVHLEKQYLFLPGPDTKNGTGHMVPLSSRAIALLKKLPRSGNARVFSMRADSITQAFGRARDRARADYEKACKEKGTKPNENFLKNLRFHDLRHEATSRLFEIGLNPIEAASVTGHKDLRMLKRYTHLKAEDLAKKLG